MTSREHNTPLSIVHLSQEQFAQEQAKSIPLISIPEKARPYPVEHLGDLREVVEVVSEALQTPHALAAQSVLSFQSFLAQAHVNIKMDSIEGPSSAFFITLAGSGERKTSLDKIFSKPLLEREKEHIKKHKETELLKNPTGVGDKKNSPESILPLSVIQEGTVEGVFKMLQGGIKSLLISTTEGGRLFGGYGMSKEHCLKSIACWSEFWDGTPVSRVRGGDTIEKVHGKRLSMHLMVQPGATGDFFTNPLYKQQGLIGRFLVFAPESLVGTRTYRRVDVTKNSVVLNYYRRVKEILDLPQPLDPDFNTALRPRFVHPSPQAYEMAIVFYHMVEKESGRGGDFEDILPFASKSLEHALRLALALNFYHNPEVREIEEKWMFDACRLVEAYLWETVRLWTQGSVDQDMQMAEKVRQWLSRNQHKTFSGQFFCQNANPLEVRRKKRAEHILKILEEHGHIFLAKNSQSLASKVWEVVSE